MELSSTEILSLTIVIGLVLYYVFNRLFLYRKMPPGPWGLPGLGSMVHLLKNDALEEIQKYKQKYGKIFSLSIGQHYVIVINDYQLVHEALKKEDFTGRPDFEVWRLRNAGDRIRGILFSDGSVWNEQRRFALRNLRDFGFGKESMEGLIVYELGELVTHLKKEVGKPFYMGNIFNASVLNSLWYILTGIRHELDDPIFKELISLLTENLKSAYLATPAFFLPWILKYNLMFGNRWQRGQILRKKTHKMITDQIDDHLKTYEENSIRDFIDSYIQHMKQSDNKSSFYDKEGKTNLLIVLHDLFVAGAETTSTTLLWAVLYLTQNPAVQKKVQEEIDLVIGTDRFPTREDKGKLIYVEAFLNEVHRMCSLVPLSVYHRMIKDTEFGGYLFPKDCIVWANIYDAHHDPAYWKDPETFRPERFIDETGTKLVKHEALMPFSVGKRVCLGEALARDTLFLFFTGMMQKFNFGPDPAGGKPDMKGVRSFVMSPKPFKVIIQNRAEKNGKEE